MPEARVGVGVLVTRKGDDARLILIGRRKGKLGGGDWALPGGHLEFGESFEECAARELLEETGLSLQQPPVFVYAVNTVFYSQDGLQSAPPPSPAVVEKHYVTIFMRCEVPSDAVPQNLEPEKCEGWEWHPLDAIPQPGTVFLPLQKLLESGYR